MDLVFENALFFSGDTNRRFILLSVHKIMPDWKNRALGTVSVKVICLPGLGILGLVHMTILLWSRLIHVEKWVQKQSI